MEDNLDICATCNNSIEPDDLPANYCYLPVCEKCLPYTLEALTEDAKNEAIATARRWLLNSALRTHKRFVRMERTESPEQSARADSILGPGGARVGSQKKKHSIWVEGYEAELAKLHSERMEALESRITTLGVIASPDGGSPEQAARDRLALIGFSETERRIAALKAELAAAKEREAALAAALKKARDLAGTASCYEVDAALSTEAGSDVFGSPGIASKSLVRRAKNAWAKFDAVIDADPAAILAAVRREARREALEGLKAKSTPAMFDVAGVWMEVVLADDLDAALAALDAEEEKQNG
jgi:uncharacterized small protein (DUF1192 family)